MVGWRARLEQFFETPDSSRQASLFALFMFAAVLVSCASLVAETEPSVYRQTRDHLQSHPLFIVESVTVAVFTLEYLARLVVARRRLRFALTPLNMCDLVSILPYFLAVATDQKALSSVRVVRAVRLVRVLRVFRLFKNSIGLSVTRVALARSSDAILMLVFFAMLGTIFFGSLIFEIEKGEWNNDKRFYEMCLDGECSYSAFQSIPHSMWWCLQTLTTVGYGSPFVPKTGWGKLVASLSMIAGILIIALPTSIIGSNFMREWERQKLLLVAKVHKDAGKILPGGGRLTIDDHVHHHLRDVIGRMEQTLHDAAALRSSGCLHQHIAHIHGEIAQCEDLVQQLRAARGGGDVPG